MYSISSPFENEQVDYVVYRSHFLGSLDTDFTAEMIHRGSSSFFNFSETQVAFDIYVDTMGVAIYNSTTTYDNISRRFKKHIRSLVDMDLNEIYRRDILYKQGAANFMMNRGDYDTFQGYVNEGAQITDFTFHDSLYIIQNEDTAFRFSDDWVISLEVSNSSNIVWTGDLDYTGTLNLIQSTLFGLKSFRIFTISGEVDFDPTGQNFVYNTSSNETHLVLVKYNEVGNVEWTNTLAKFEEMVENSGFFEAGMDINGDEQIQLYYKFEGNLGNDTTGTLSAFVLNDIIDSGSLTPLQTSRHSPLYSYSIIIETGEIIKVFKVYNNSSNGGYTTSESGQLTTLQEVGRVSFTLENLYYLSTPFVVQRLFPDFQDFTLLNDSPAGFEPYQFISLSTQEGLDDFKQYNLYHTTIFDASVQLRHIPLQGENMMFAGESVKSSDVYVGSTLLNFQNNPEAEFGQDGLVIYAEAITVSTRKMGQSELGLEVFPNPVSDDLQIKFDSDKPFRYHLYNSIGACIQSGTISSSGKIDVRTYSNGLYILQIQNESEAFEFIKIEKLE